GSAGKGFAVVADEVRNLASKSAEAAKGTTALIEGAVTAVANGTKLADDTAKSLVSVVEGTTNVSQIINKISTASNEQANAITQVTMGVDQISSVVQTNSATAEESAAASEELSSQAAMLKSLVSKFNLKDVDMGASTYKENYTAPSHLVQRYQEDNHSGSSKY
ncbi:MAG: methyl-accepting chemotaxis protein, partial [Oscillospiraceae bacterium]